MSLVASLAEVLPGAAAAAADDRWPWADEPPQAVVHPSSTDEVAATVRWAAANGVGVAVVASGRRFRGTRPKGLPFLILATDRLVGTDIYEPADLTITAKVGSRVSAVSAELRAQRQWLPYDPPHLEERTLGGLVASGESGPLWMGYGELRNHVLGATLVTGDGRVVRLGGRVVKNVAGFDTLKAVVGSRGTLGVLTSVCVRAFPVPASDRLLVLRGESAADLLTVARAVGTAPLLPVSSVVVTPAPVFSAAAALLVRLHGAEPTVEADQRTLEEHCGVSFERVGASGPGAGVPDHATDGALALDASVLPTRLPEALVAIRDTIGEVPLAIDTYRGALRASIGASATGAATRLTTRIEALGGALSVRSCVPGIEVEALGSRPSRAVTELTKRLESAFDPQGVLWPSRP